MQVPWSLSPDSTVCRIGNVRETKRCHHMMDLTFKILFYYTRNKLTAIRKVCPNFQQVHSFRHGVAGRLSIEVWIINCRDVV